MQKLLSVWGVERSVCLLIKLCRCRGLGVCVHLTHFSTKGGSECISECETSICGGVCVCMWVEKSMWLCWHVFKSLVEKKTALLFVCVYMSTYISVWSTTQRLVLSSLPTSKLRRQWWAHVYAIERNTRSWKARQLICKWYKDM